ncbi:MAG: glycosyltransferase [Candidatus Berkelbacteria bacterium]
MKILFVAMGESIHTERWISQISDQNWEIHLAPSTYSSSRRRQIKNVFFHTDFKVVKDKKSGLARYTGLNLFVNRIITLFKVCRDKIWPDYRAQQLNRLIKQIKPDIIHSLEFQSAGYLVSRAKQLYDSGQFPKWIATNWGNDIYFFARFKDHQAKIKTLLETCDYYSCECNRDVCLAKNHGFKGKVLPVYPNTGGFDLKKVWSWRQKGLTSQRRIILIKGYHGIFGRALLALKALEQCVDVLSGYKIVFYSVDNKSVLIPAIKDFTLKTGVPVEIVPYGSSHEKILRMHGKARISIGLNVSDGVSTAFLEALVMGSFPVQSNTACVDEWIENGQTGMIVPPENIKKIAQAIRLALTDNSMVDAGVKKNWQTAKKRLDYLFLKNKTVKFYNEVAKN